MSQAIDGLGSWLADVYLLSTFLLLLAAFFLAFWRQPARRMAGARATLAGLALIAVLAALPMWPRLAWRSLVRLEEGVSRGVPPEPESPGASGAGIRIPRVQAIQRGSRPTPEPEVASSPAVPNPVEPVIRLVDWSVPPWSLLALWGFVFGFSISLVWLVLGAIQVARLRRASRPPSGRLEAIFTRLAQMEIRAPRLRVSTRIGLPVAIGVSMPLIVFPHRFAESEPEERLEAALAHEWAHIRNGDLLWLAIGRLLLPILFAHPLYWWLRRRIRLDQEVLADAAAAPQSDRTAYAEVLLAWARQTAMAPQDGFASALALWEHPSQLRRRIAVLLDPKLRVEPRCPRGWKLGSWGFALLSALLMSFVTLHPVRGRMEAPLIESPQSAVAFDQVVFQGRVVDPEGKPFPGARIYLGYYWETHDEKPAALRATSGPDGRFRFSVEKALFNHIQIRELEPWNEARLLAVAPGMGLGLSDSKEPDASHDVTLKLVPDDVPITGRLIDLEGRPVASAVVGVNSINASLSGSLNSWVQEIRAGKEVSYQLEQRHLPVEVYLGENECPIPRVHTDQQGRFRIEGVGRQRLVGLTIEGDSVRQMKPYVITRVGDPLRVRDDFRPNPSFKTYQPARFELSVAPGRVITGTVRGKDNGEPVAGANVTAIHRQSGGDTLFVRTKTDKAGLFRLAGMPVEAGIEIGVFPRDQPFFGALVKTKDSGGSQPLNQDFRLHRGIWAEGKVSDKITGQPVPGFVRYAAAADNPHIDEASGYRELAADSPYVTARETRKDGSFRVPVLPGRGVLIVSEASPRYPELSRTEYGAFRSTPYLPAYGPVQAYKTITVSEDGQPIRHDFTLDEGKSLAGTVLDFQGRPVSGTDVFGVMPNGGWTSLAKSGEFKVHGLRPGPGRSLAKLLESHSPEGIASFIQPESPRTLVFLNPASHLAGAIAVRSSDAEPLRVGLQPDANVTGRLVTADGQPRSDTKFQVYYLGYDLLDDYIYFPQFVRKTDQEGRFHIEGVAPGLRLRIWLGDAVDRSRTFPPLKPGESRNVEDVGL